MRRTHSTDESQAVSLFPFLAVLLSTMGSLLLLLVVMARQARLQAAQEDEGRRNPPAAAEPAEAPEPSVNVAPADRQRLEEQLARLRAMQEEGRQELEASRQRLRNGDAHLLQLRNELEAFYRQGHELEQMGEQRLDDHERARNELTRLQELIEQTEAKLAEERQAAASQKKSYAIVPYEGPHGTRRRPLYIECRRDNVILQPEGITLEAADFMGPLGPGNPLASALRVAEDYYAGAAQPGQPPEEPYPLILVRPDGITAYYFVRKALEGWGTEFGYELLDGEWDLEFSLPNPTLANSQQQAIEIARARQQALVMAAPGHFGGGGGRGPGNAYGGSFSSLAETDPPLGTSGDGDSFGGEGGPGNRPPTGDRYAMAPGAASAASSPQHGSHAGPGDAALGTQSMQAPSPSSRYGNGESHSFREGTVGDQQGDRSGTPSHANGRHQPGQAPQTQAGMGPSPGGSQPNGGSARTGQANASTGATGANSIGAAASVEPLAVQRGANWALPQAGSGAVPVRRTIQIVVRHDRLAILNGPGVAAGRVIPVGASIERAVDPLVQAVSEQIESWGIAGRGMYWQPILVFQPGPDGTAHAAALRTLLAGSGLEIAP